FPKKDQAIILEAIEGIDVKDYIFALAKLVPPSSIMFGSRIANLRVCIYLDSSKTADNLIEVSKTVQVKDQVLPIKPLVTRNKRVVLSNVCPVIPHYVITDKLEELGIRAMSSLTFMKIGISEPGYSHILSFRRQLYISPEDEVKLPSSFQVYHEDIGYWIYSSTDSLKCFICNNTGHIAKNCPKNSSEGARDLQNQTIPARDLQEQSQEHLTEDQIDELMNSLPPTQLISASKDLKTTASSPEEPSMEIETDKTAGTKRPHSATTETSGMEDRVSADNLMVISDQPSTGLDGNFIMSKAGRKKKKSKQAKSPAQDERTEAQVWQDLDYEVISSPGSYPLNLKQFRSLMDVTLNNKPSTTLVMDIIQWNINGFHTRFEMIKLLNNIHNPHILCLQETNFRDNYHSDLKNFSCFHENRIHAARASGGVAIYANPSTLPELIILNTNLEAIAIRIKFPKAISICSIYLPNRSQLSIPELENLVKSLPKPMIISGDFNCHHPLWGSENHDQRGLLLADWLNTHDDLIALNTGEPTHFNSSNANTSCIDLTIVSSELALLLDWSVLEDTFNSDHFPIVVKLSTNNNNQQLNTERPLWANMFADDLTILGRGKDVKILEELIQATLDKLLTWSERTGFKFSDTKTEYMLFTRGHQRYKRLNIIKSLASTVWGAEKNCLLTTYKALIRQKIEYGAIIYDSAHPHVLKALETLQNSALRISLGAYRTSPVTSLLAEALEVPLSLRRKELVMTYAAKKRMSPDNPVKECIFRTSTVDANYSQRPTLPNPLRIRLKKYSNEFNLELSCECMDIGRPGPPWFNLNTPSLAFRNLFLELKNKYEHHEEYYTDGSKVDNNAGCSVIINNTSYGIKLQDYHSIFTCEAWAIHKAIKLIEDNPTQHQAVIFSDSKSTLHAIRNPLNCNPLINLIQNKLVVLSRLRIGHTKMTHSHIMTKEPSPQCQRCGEILTIKHILIECNNYNPERRKTKL
ncbi:GSCOCG00011340001-RA-CDS, partial [Cotesia congregata]